MRRSRGNRVRSPARANFMSPPAGTDEFHESGHRHQTNIIRTSFSELEKGSDYLFISHVMSKRIFPRVAPSCPTPSSEGHARRKPKLSLRCLSHNSGIYNYHIFFGTVSNNGTPEIPPKSLHCAPCFHPLNQFRIS